MTSRTVLALALAATLAAPAWAANSKHPDITIYRSGSAGLFSAAHAGSIDAGHAVVHEDRTLQLTKGTQDVVINNLPDFIDPEAVHLRFDSGKTQVLSQRLLLPHGQNGTLSGQIGKPVTVYGDSGQQLVKGTLVQVNPDGSLVIGGDVFGPTLVHSYSAVKLTGGRVGGGARLEVRVAAKDAGATNATLVYPTSGIGWRAAYTGIVQPGHDCRMRIQAQASIANRSGRDWTDAHIKLVAGSPRFAKGNSARPRVQMMAAKSAAAPAPMPQQGTLGDYHTYVLPGAVSLPKASVTLTPLYKPRTIDCQRTWLFEHGRTWQPPKPYTRNASATTEQGPVQSTLSFTAFDSFPAGYVRVLTVDNDGNAEFLGSSQVGDTPKGQTVHMVLGTAFDLTGTRTLTNFQLNQAANYMDVGYRITLTNAGKTARTVTVREHPWRWRNWKLTSSSTQPSNQTADTLDFKVKVPAGGKATLDYAVRYSWTAAEE